MGNRVYNEKVLVDTDKIKKFYNDRASKAESFDNEYTLVLLKDSKPELAQKRDEFEKKVILPQLNMNSDSNVIDIGCGIGRWADALANKVHSYVGIDFSESMIHLASRRFESYDNVQFYVSSFQNFETVIKKRFDRLIIGGGVYVYK